MLWNWKIRTNSNERILSLFKHATVIKNKWIFQSIRLDSILDIYVSLKNVIEKNNKIAIWKL